MAELRQDPILRRWVIMSSVRGKRPSDFSQQLQPEQEPHPGPCAFCPHQEHETGEEVFALREIGAKNAPDWRVRVVMNKYPAVSMESKNNGITEEGPFQACRMDGFGTHEVVIETPDHNVKFSNLPLWNVKEVLGAFRYRIYQLKEDKRLKYVQIFKNHGNDAGASMRHSHSQIIALPVIPHDMQDEIDGARQYYERTGRCPLCEAVDYDIKDKKRVIHESPEFVAIAPFASRFPFETWIVPRKHGSDYQEISDSELQGLADILLLILRKLDFAFKNPSYNYTLQTSPLQEHCNVQYYHWYIRIVPHLIKLGGFELGSGSHINPIFPEKAAEFLREFVQENSFELGSGS